MTTPAAVFSVVRVTSSEAPSESAPAFCTSFANRIEDLDAAVFSDENVLGFQVAVDDSLFVRAASPCAIWTP